MITFLDDRDKAEIEEAISELADKKITKFYANSLGETTLNDSDNGKIQDMIMYGKSEQKSYSGKNLFKAENHGIITVTDDGLLLNGTTEFHQFISFTIPAGSYFVGEMNGDMHIHSYIDNFDSYMKDVGAITFETDKMLSFYIVQGTYRNVLIKPYIVEDSNPMETYEPYVGGIPSPNPDYPQEIKSVVNPKLMVRCKNLVQKVIYGYINQSNHLYIDNDSISVIAYLEKEKTYKISCGKTLDRLKIGQLETPNIVHGTPLTNVYEGDVSRNTFIANFTGYACIYIKSVKDTDIINTIQVEEEQTVTIPYTLNAIPVSSGGNVTIEGHQYIADYVDVERGKLVRMIGVANQDAFITSKWEITGSIVIFSLISNVKGETAIVTISSEYSASWSAGDEIHHFTQPTGQTLNMVLPKTITTVEQGEEIRAKGFKFYYTLATPIETDLTEEEITALKELTTYYPTTNVSVSSEQLDGYTVFNYPISMANGWNYVKQQLNDNRDYIYDMDLQSAEAYVNSEYAVTLTELEI